MERDTNDQEWEDQIHYQQQKYQKTSFYFLLNESAFLKINKNKKTKLKLNFNELKEWIILGTVGNFEMSKPIWG